MKLTNPVKAALQRGELSFGSWITISHPVVAELMAEAGLDWLAVDTEHGVNSLESSLCLVQAMKGTTCVPFVRLPANDPIWIRRYLDAGFLGLIVPLVNTAGEASAVVRVAKYPPYGRRGIGISRAHTYGRSFDHYMSHANCETMVVPQVEHVDSVENIDKILAVEGVDAVLVGPYDLAGSMGLLGQFDHPRMLAALDTVLEACERSGKAAGIHVVYPSMEEVQQRIEQGFRFIALSMDILMLSKGCTELLAFSEALRSQHQP
jgi:2-dehydro-3-deoxyglucarate aldolase